MFAGAVRETVLSNPAVIRRIKSQFVPVALKAALVNNPPVGPEGRLYAEIGRSKIAPQGICVANSDGKVLEWVISFDDDKSVLAFLDHSLRRYRRFPDARQPVTAERHMRFPSVRLEDVRDRGSLSPLLVRHVRPDRCLAAERLPRGTLVARLFGRTLTSAGKLSADTNSQYHYVEDRFNVSPALQRQVAEALAVARTDRVRLPREFGRLAATYAHLGMLDVQVLDNPAGAKGELRQCEFWAKRSGETSAWRIEGQSEVFTDKMANAGPGDLHEVKLEWEGLVEIKGERFSRLLLWAHGSERLKFGSAERRVETPVRSLPGGRPVDLARRVRYGIIAEPAGLPASGRSTR